MKQYLLLDSLFFTGSFSVPDNLKIRDNFLIAVKSLLRRPLRTIIVLQGIIWGVALTVFPASLREGAHNQARLRAQELGIDRISIHLQDAESGDALTLEDCAEIDKTFGPKSAAPKTRRILACAPVNVKEGRKARTAESANEITTDIIHTTPQSEEARSFRAAKGRYITQQDIDRHGKVCVLEALIAKELFGEEDPVGRTIFIQYSLIDIQPYRVVGVMEKRSEEQLSTDDYGFKDKGDKSIVERFTRPLGLMRPDEHWKRSEMSIHTPLIPADGPATKVEWILLRAANADTTRDVENAINDFLLERGRTVAVYGNLFYPMLIASEQDVSSRLYLAIMIASMLMSGLAIVNTMLIAVLERAREIAIRRIEGARKRDIAAQFLTETLLMCFIGAVTGVPVGLGLAWSNILLRPRFHTLSAVALPWGEVLPVIGIALLVGVLAGLLPARRAAQVDPVVTLSRSA